MSKILWNKTFKLYVEFILILAKTFIKTNWQIFHFIPRILPIVGLVGIGCWGLNYQQRESIASAQTPVNVLQTLQFSDPDYELSLLEILNLPDVAWQEVSAINYGYVGGSGWSYIKLESNQTQSVLMELQTHFLNSVNVWLVNKERKLLAVPTGFSILSDKHIPMNHRYFLAELPLVKNQSYGVFIRSSTTRGFPMKFQVQFWDQESFVNYTRASDWGWALFSGMVLTAIFVSFFSFIIHQKPIYFYFAAYLICFSLYAMVNDGWGLFLNAAFYKYINPIQIGHILNLGIFFFLLFSREFLVIKADTSKWWLLISPWWFYLAITFCIFVTNTGYSNLDGVLTKTGYWLGITFVISVVLLWVSYLVNALQRGFRPAWLLLASQLFLILFFSANIVLVNLITLYLPSSDMLLLRIAITAQLFLIAVGWIYRQKVIRDSQEGLSALNLSHLRAVWEAENRWQELQLKTLRMENEIYGQRERLARDLHDGIGSQLTHIISRLDMLSFPESVPQNQLLRLRDFTRETNQNLRETIWILNQEEITCSKFALRMHSFLLNLWEDQEYPNLTWNCPKETENPTLSPQVTIHLFRITQEAIANIIKHAGASEVNINLEFNPTQVILTIRDNGKGFNLELPSNGFGLENMRKRAAEMGGNLDVESGNYGTNIIVTLSLAA